MLIDFECVNFRSFRDTARISMEAVKAFKENEDRNTFSASRYRLLKSAAIYGPNAGGKSNFVRAVAFMQDFIRNSAKEKQVGDPISITPFKLDSQTENAPSRFQVTLLDGEKRFRYGFEVDTENVCAEWLLVSDLSKTRSKERALFLRESGKIEIKDGISDGKALTSRTRENALFLSTAAQWNEPMARRVIDLLGRIRAVFSPHLVFRDISFEMLTRQDERNRLLAAVRMVDSGIDNLKGEEREMDPAKLQELPPRLAELISKGKVVERRVFAEHTKYDGENKVGSIDFDLETEESEGTKKFYRTMGPILDTLNNGYTVFADELEAMLHPLLTRAIVRLFHSPETNPKNAQLIFCTHDTGLLSNVGLRRDQIWFVEKSAKGASSLYPLSDFKNVRKDTSIETDYIKGRFGAVPFFGGWEALSRLVES